MESPEDMETVLADLRRNAEARARTMSRWWTMLMMMMMILMTIVEAMLITQVGTQRLEPYLIFVRNAGNAVSVKFLAECKKIPEKNEEITALGSVYIITVIT